MTTGVPIFLVSACGTGEEFVAAFRRYADKNGLFIPIAAPIPAGRRGRFAVTLKDGGVMIEGEADIVSSATTPSVLHGRVGMTLRFVEPDIKSKTVLVELEQARLAMKPQPPSVPPRPAQIPAEPRPKVPSPAGRIDANNALAECVAIGNVDALETTVPQVPKGASKFVVPAIPPVGAQRPKSPSTPPLAYPALAKPPARAQTPSTPPPIVPPPAIPPAPVAAAAPVTPMSITTVDAPITPPSVTPMSITTVDAPIVTPTGMAAVAVPKSVTMGWDIPPAADEETTGEQRDTVAMAAIDPTEAIAEIQRSRTPSDELTIVPQARDAEVLQIVVPPGSDSDTFPAVHVRTKQDSDTFPATPPPRPDGVPEPVPVSSSGSISKPNGNSGRIGLPPPRRTSGNTNPPPKNPTPAAPLPVVAKPKNPTPAAPLPIAKPSSSAPIATNRSPTRIGLPIVELKTPAPPSGEIPLPPVVADPKPPAPEASDEPTDITAVPVAVEPVPEPMPERPSVPGGQRKTVIGVAVVPEGVMVLPAAPAAKPTPPTEESIAAAGPSMKVEVNLEPEPAAPAFDAASEPTPADPRPIVPPPVIEEPSGDWTMVPGELGPTILPRKPEPAAAGDDQRLPTGDWTIARVEDSPDGWSEPSKAGLKPVRANIRQNTGPPVPMVAGEKPLEETMTAKAFDIEEETKSGLKIEVDSSLPVERPASHGDVALASTQFAAPQPPLTPVPGTLMPVAMQVATMHPPPPMASSSAPAMMRVPSHGSGSFPDYPTASRSSAPAHLFGGGDESTSIVERNRRRRIIIIAASAGAAIVAGVVLLLVFGLGGSEASKPADPKASIAKQPAITPPAPDAAEPVGSAPAPADVAADAGAPEAVETPADAAPEVAVAPPDSPKPATECVVEVTSSPSGADILHDKQVVGTTPAKLSLPCGVQAKLVLKKARYANAARTVKPTAKGVKVRVALAKPLLSVKVTSSPPGATITLGGKSLGVTPAVVKLPANEAATLVISKVGFLADTQKLTPKQNNQAVHATLRKKGR